VAGKAFQRLPRTLASIRYKRLATIFVKDSGQIDDARQGNDRAPHSKSTPRVIFITDRGRDVVLGLYRGHQSHRDTPGSKAMSGSIESVKPIELTPNELELVSGGLSFNFSKIEVTYVQQKPDGSESAPKPNR
jgi:hypothetical protein